MPGSLCVADAKMLPSATSIVFTLTPFADIHAFAIKAVNAVK